MNILERLRNLWSLSGLTPAQSEQVKRVGRFVRAWDAYYGRLPKPLKVRPGQSDDNVSINLSGVIVDKGVAWLFGQEVEVLLDEGRETAQAWLDAAWDVNGDEQLWQKFAVNGAVCGTAFARIVWPSPMTTPYPRVVALDPGLVDVETAPDDLERVTRYTITWPAPKDGKYALMRQIITPTETGAAWDVIDQQQVGGEWVTLAASVWPWPWPPISHTQNLPAPNEWWGRADLEEDVVGLNQSINFARSNLARILRWHAHPKTWGKGFSAGEMSVAVDETIILGNPDASLQNLEMISDLSSSRAFAQDLEAALHEIARVPEIATGRVEGLGDLSGVALRVLYAPLIEKTETKRRQYGRLLIDLSRKLLTLSGQGSLTENIHMQWPELLPSDPLQERQIAVLDQQLGASQSTILKRLGFDPEAEASARETDGAQLGAQLLGAFNRGE